jgi:hypothetical protein
MLAWILPFKYCAKLCTKVKTLIESECFQKNAKKDKKDFIRERTLPFTHVFSSILMCNPGPLNTRIRRFFENFIKKQSQPPTKSALCQARDKLLPSAFQTVSNYVVDNFYCTNEFKKWHNYRVLSIDGSSIKLPKIDEIIKEFGLMHPRQGGSCPLARFSILSDTLNGLTIDAQLKPWQTGEITVAFEHLSHVCTNDIVLLDRGYRSIALLYKLMKNGTHFCHRVNIARWRFASDFLASDEDDQIITMPLTYCTKKELKEKWGISIDSFTFRAIKVKLVTGETEILITSIMDENVSTNDFLELYGYRWPIEESYKVHKSRTVIESFSGKKVNVIYQDFYAKILLANLGAIFFSLIQPQIEKNTANLKHKFRTNLNECLRILNEKIHKVFFAVDMNSIVKEMIDNMVRYIEPVRKNRRYPRNLNERRKRYNPNYLPVS